MARHYIAMSGSKGCLPDFCQSCDTLKDAHQALGDLLDLSDAQLTELINDKYTECIPDQGAEYAEIQTCNCNAPEIHNDN